MTYPLAAILSLYQTMQDCWKLRDWSEFLGFMDAHAELERVMGEVK